MRLICIGNSAESLPARYKGWLSADAVPGYRWPIDIGKEYMAAAVVVFRGCVTYLVRMDREACPDFVPAPLFRVVNGMISSQWRFWAPSQPIEGVVDCVIGYAELTDGSSHLDDLADGKHDAVQLFARRLTELERDIDSSTA